MKYRQTHTHTAGKKDQVCKERRGGGVVFNTKKWRTRAYRSGSGDSVGLADLAIQMYSIARQDSNLQGPAQ